MSLRQTNRALHLIIWRTGGDYCLKTEQSRNRHLSLFLYHQLEKAGTLTTAEAQQRAKNVISNIRFGEGDYFFIIDMQTRMVMHPIMPELNGKDQSGTEDSNGIYLFQELVQRIRENGQGFVNYHWSKPGHKQPVPNLSYIEGFTPWGWGISTGIYINDVDEIFMQKAVTQDGIALLFMLMAGFIPFSIIRQLSEQIEDLQRLTDESPTLLGRFQL